MIYKKSHKRQLKTQRQVNNSSINLLTHIQFHLTIHFLLLHSEKRGFHLSEPFCGTESLMNLIPFIHEYF